MVDAARSGAGAHGQDLVTEHGFAAVLRIRRSRSFRSDELVAHALQRVRDLMFEGGVPCAGEKVLARKTSKPRRARRSRRPSDIPMVQAADPRQRDHLPELPRLYRASDRRVAVEPHVRAVLVVVGGVLADQVQEMTLTKHDHVIEQLSMKGDARRDTTRSSFSDSSN